MGDTFRDLDVVKDEYLTARRDFGTRIKAKEEHIRELTKQLREGETKREVPCTARAHLDRGELVVTRDDTGEEVSWRTLTAREIADYNQLRLDLDAAPTADAAVAIRTAFAARVVADAALGAGPPQPGVHLSSKQEEPKRMQEVEFTADDPRTSRRRARSRTTRASSPGGRRRTGGTSSSPSRPRRRPRRRPPRRWTRPWTSSTRRRATAWPT